MGDSASGRSPAPTPGDYGSAPGGHLGTLLEREREAAEVERAVEDAVSGVGRAVIVEGPAGIGKTRLLAVARRRAGAVGAQQLAAGGGDLERDVSFGVVRQLFEPVLFAGEEDPRLLEGLAARAAALLGGGHEHLPRSMSDTYAVFDSLYWLCTALAERAPLLVSVDDAHLADPPSLRFLDFLARRLDDLPLAVVLAVRDDELATESSALSAMATSPLTAIVRPPPLSESAVARLVADALVSDPAPAFVQACHSATGGNPFLVHALLAELRHQGIAPLEPNVALLERIGPRSVGRAVLLRLMRVSADAASLATAVAVIGDGAAFSHAAALAGLDGARARSAADALAGAGILRSARALSFQHPLVRQAIYEDLAHSDRSRLHLEAARILERVGAAPDVVAAHLLRVYPQQDESIVHALRLAGRGAIDQGSVETAVTYLRRALEERPSGEEEPALLLELGEAELKGGLPEAVCRLEAAAAAARMPLEQARALRLLGAARLGAGLAQEAIEAYRAAIAAAGSVDRDLELQLEAELVGAAQMQALAPDLIEERLVRFDRNLGERALGECLVLMVLAFQAVRTNQPAADAAALVRRSLTGGRLLDELPLESPPLYVAATALIQAEDFDAAASLLERMLEDARASGSPLASAWIYAHRADLGFRRGSLAPAEADARASIGAQGLHEALALPLATTVLIEILLEKADLDAAEDALQRHGIGDSDREEVKVSYSLYGRGRLRAGQGRLGEAVNDLLTYGRRLGELGVTGVAAAPWRSAAALAHHGLGDRREAERLAEEELVAAQQFGAPRATGMALRAAGMIKGGERGVELLREAVAVLEPSGARLEHARALVDLGAALRRAGTRQEARGWLEQGLELAEACGATALAKRCGHELAAAGPRPRSVARRGADALTASERRVAEMAAGGRSNREIAQALFISHKTVEKHLYNAYMKLGVDCRSALQDVIATPRR